MKNTFSFNSYYLLAFLVMFAIETGIAFFVRDSFIRPYGGDILVVILVYFFVRIFYRKSEATLPIYVFLFAFLIEVLQWCDITHKLNLQDNPVLRTVLGTSFEWWDVVCYLVGTILIYAFVYKRQLHR